MSEMSSEETTEFDKYDASYEQAVDESIAFSGLKVQLFTKAKADYVLQHLRRHFGATDRLDLLDVGCGIGTYQHYLAKSVGSTTGVDISRACIERARRDNPTSKYEVYDGRALPFASESFDAAYAICVMHHVPPPRWPDFLIEMRRVLRPGGLAFVFEHNPYNILTRKAVSSCVFDKDAVLMTASKAVGLFRDAGLRAVKSRYILTIPPIAPWLRSVDRAFARVPIGAQYYVVGEAPV
jgi:ubiquinone/menaquinone biosynthesis C-methylase UbiE